MRAQPRVETKITGRPHLLSNAVTCAMAAPARNENATGSVSAAAAAAVAAMTTTTPVTATTTIMPTTMELPTDASSYTFLGKIGQGAFATVWKAKTTSSVLSMSSQSSLQQLPSDSSKNQQQQQQHQQEKQPQQQYVAVKVLNLDHVDSDLQEIRKEVQLMRLSLHPNILYCHTAFLEQTQLWVVTPFMNKGSSVSCLLQARRSLKIRYKKLTQQQQEQGQSTTTTTPTREELLHPPKVSLEPHILYILQQTLLGLQYIHDNGQIHRDIKGSNILLNGAGEVKIADFGVSGWLIPQNEKAKTFVGTPCWMAPGESVYPCSVLFSVVVCLYSAMYFLTKVTTTFWAIQLIILTLQR